MRERLRAYERERKRLDRQVTLHHVHVRIRQSDRRSVAVVMFACGMVAVAAYQILR